MTEIEKYGLLPTHTRLNYYECYAKIVLESVFPELFNDLTIADKPDLQSSKKNIGVEVTTSEEPAILEAQRLYSQLPCMNSEKIKKSIDRIKQCGAKYENEMLISSGIDNFDLVNKAVKTKTEKLQKTGYAELKEYYLFVFSPISADNFMLQEELDFLQRNRAGEYWKEIYVSVPGELYCFSFEKATYKKISVTSELQMQYALQARKMVEEGEQIGKT